MPFNSIAFVLFFFCIAALYYLCNLRWQNRVLLVGSYIFYGWWDWRFLSLIAISTIVDYIAGLKIYGASNQGNRQKWLWVSLITNLGLLATFKYFNFFAGELSRILELLGLSSSEVTLSIVLPVGISFYTFQTLSYSIDIYRRNLKPTRNFENFALFVSFFPQLVAGPIERATHFLPQIEKPRTILSKDIFEGFYLIATGYFLKLVIADNFAIVANAVFNAPASYTSFGTILGIYAFAFQIFGDFAGYSSIARGLSQMLGFDLMVNFNNPYFAQSPSEFWQRWHISLSSWLRDYLYIPLGGNRGGTFLNYRNLMLTMLLGGLWHGAAWKYVLWGGYHGVLLIGYRMFASKYFSKRCDLRKKNKSKIFGKMFLMFHFVCFGWVLFRMNSVYDLPVIVRSLLTFPQVSYDFAFKFAVLTLSLLLFSIAHKPYERLDEHSRAYSSVVYKRVAMIIVMFAMILWCGVVDHHEFIYFQF